MSNNPAKYEVLIKQYSCSILDIHVSAVTQSNDPGKGSHQGCSIYRPSLALTFKYKYVTTYNFKV